jgi:dihydroorotate dehydrogenase (NAD+) catalytic subunit
MTVRVAGLELVNPVIAASGTFGYGIEFEEIVSLERIGGFVTKASPSRPWPATPRPASSRPPPACSTPSASRT